MRHSRPRSLAAATLVSLIALTGCSAAAASPSTGAPEPETAEFPRTVEVPEGQSHPAHTITIEEAPTSIAALDYESAEVIAELGLAEHLVLIPEAVLNPALGGHIEALSQVPAKFPVAMNLDAETVIASHPDLVVMSPRHGTEDTIGTVLEQAGLTTLQLPSSWTDLGTTTENIGLIGEVTGTEPEAAKLKDQLTTGLADAAAERPGSETDDAPRVLVLTNQAGRPFLTAGNAYPLQLLDLAGATSVSAELGVRGTSPVSVEQVVQANPDGVLLIDMNGTGDRMYAELLSNPAVAALPAVEQDLMLRLTGREVQALGLNATISGLDTLTEWVGTLR